jgi:putative transposase
MRRVESLSHTRWECKYHIVFIPKYRRKHLFGQIRKELGEVFPMNQKAEDLMMGAPSEVSERYLKEFHLKVVKEKPE